jgi:hypothetical protein
MLTPDSFESTSCFLVFEETNQDRKMMLRQEFLVKKIFSPSKQELFPLMTTATKKIPLSDGF